MACSGDSTLFRPCVKLFIRRKHGVCAADGMLRSFGVINATGGVVVGQRNAVLFHHGIGVGRRNPPTGRRCGCCVKCGKNSTCAMQMLSWRRSMHTMGKRGKAASIISSGRKSAALSAKRWQHHPRLCSTCFDVLGKHRQRHRRTRTRRTRTISTICWI